MDARTKKELEVMRRILYSFELSELSNIRERFQDIAECISDVNQEALDYIDWLIRRTEIL